MECIYTGWFVSGDELARRMGAFAPERLEKVIDAPHVTLAFRPSNGMAEKYGTTATVIATGYGNDGNNEALLVKLKTEDEELQQEFDKIKTPHITLSVSAHGKPISSRDLEFQSIDPFTLEGIFGAFCTNGEVITTSK